LGYPLHLNVLCLSWAGTHQQIRRFEQTVICRTVICRPDVVQLGDDHTSGTHEGAPTRVPQSTINDLRSADRRSAKQTGFGKTRRSLWLKTIRKMAWTM